MGQILGNASMAKNYKAQASTIEAQGRAQQAAYNLKAANTEEEARADTRLAGANMMRQRQNQTAALATARNTRAASGFTEQGSGQQSELALADIFETAIADMALSNAIGESNKRHAASVSRQQGRLIAMQAGAQAAQNRRLAKSAQNAAWIQGGITAASALIGGISSTGAATGTTAASATAVAGQGTATAGSILPTWATRAIRTGNNAYDLTGTFLQSSPGAISASQQTATNAGDALNALLASFLSPQTHPKPPSNL
ncbi:hypothetical protein [Akkermansia glycaniphila]|uniref:Uncharacterized protein n=1 Tax=Akkermansia glycaniphila TaxID=1679444 RepID=A0A1C7PAW2_9BACT|nr:hypothetical protein [Akkermansia glycaniphila]OCA02723.1 hypothetical protein AC781_08780 [Akkermansia glycaniphila]SEH97506.1 Hypothetical protein PYTT_2220 [Akkermansia glycaniphila]